jgi:hypothetical protein
MGFICLQDRFMAYTQNSLDQITSQVPSNSRMFYYSKFSQSLGSIIFMCRQSGFSVNSFLSGLLRHCVSLLVCV